MRRGVYPGSFNPPTMGHLAIVEAVLSQRRLDRLDMVVSRVALGKGAVPRPTLDERIDVLAASVAHLEVITVTVTEHQLLVDIAAGYDVLVMGADKWRQVNDPVFYGGSPRVRDDAVGRLPELAIAARPPDPVPAEHVLHLPPWVSEVSSTAARAGAAHQMTPPARASGLWAPTLETDPATIGQEDP